MVMVVVEVVMLVSGGINDDGGGYCCYVERNPVSLESFDVLEERRG